MGKRCAGTRIQFGGPRGTSNAARAQAITDRYPAGAAVEVIYDPAKPTLCTLDRTISTFGIVLMIGIGLICLAFGIGTLVSVACL